MYNTSLTYCYENTTNIIDVDMIFQTRDALKLKLQRYTQGLEVKIAQPTNPSVNKD